MNKNKFRKTGVGLLCGALAITGTYAWLKNSETAQKQNVLKAGNAQVVFEDGTNSISLANNEAIPMTNEYAVANLTPYTFKVTNKGTVDMEYSLTAVNEDGTTIDSSLVMIQLDGRTPITLANANLMSGKKIAAGTSDNHSLIAYIKDTGTINDSLNKVVNFHLELTATQTDMSVLPTITTSYANVEKSQIATSITAGGETKNVEVYNIEGESKTELMNKLQESGLANPSDVDALVEVKGEDYDGLNSTATFDVSSVANPGDAVVILHFNEVTQEWEYIGEETVGEDNTVSGDFTSYSPVAFVVISNNSGGSGDSGPGSAGDVEADGSVLINETNFPDEKFRNYVATNFDTNGDGKLASDERNAVTRIDVRDEGITTLQGVEYFTALTYLNCFRNQLTTLDVSKNTALTDLGCGFNQLTTLDVSKNTALTSLECNDNQLITLDLYNNTALDTLWCRDNQLTTLDVSKNTALTYLDCRLNRLSTLDVSNNTALTRLECSNNTLTTLDVSNNTVLNTLQCRDNQLTTLDLTHNPSLNSGNISVDDTVAVTYYEENPGLTDKMYYVVPTKIYDYNNLIDEGQYKDMGYPSEYEEYTGTIYKYTMVSKTNSDKSYAVYAIYSDKNFYGFDLDLGWSLTSEYGQNFNEETPVKAEEIKIGDIVTVNGETATVIDIFKTTEATEVTGTKFYVYWYYNITPSAPVLHNEFFKKDNVSGGWLEEGNFVECTGDIYKIEYDMNAPQGSIHIVDYVDREEVEVTKYVDSSGQYSVIVIPPDDTDAVWDVGGYEDEEGNFIACDQVESVYTITGVKVR